MNSGLRPPMTKEERNKLVRNTSDEQSRAFWDAVKKSADTVRAAPAWMRAGINLNDRNYTTFGPRPSTQASTRHRPNREAFKELTRAMGWTQERFDAWASGREWAEP